MEFRFQRLSYFRATLFLNCITSTTPWSLMRLIGRFEYKILKVNSAGILFCTKITIRKLSDNLDR